MADEIRAPPEYDDLDAVDDGNETPRLVSTQKLPLELAC